MTLKDRIKELCKEKNISMNQLEKELGFGVGYISKLGSTTPNVKKIQLIADYFNVTVDYLMTGKQSEFSIEMAKIDGNLFFMDKIIKDYALKLNSLNNDERKLVFNLIDGLADKKEE